MAEVRGYLSPSSEIKFTDVPNGLAAATKVPAVGWFQRLGYGLIVFFFFAKQRLDMIQKLLFKDHWI